MPVNPNAPFGFKFIKMLDGLAPTYGVRQGLIKGGSGGNTNLIFQGDVLKVPSAGFLDVWTTETSGGAFIGGVAESFEWPSIAQQKTVRQNYWPGTPTDVVGGGNVKINYYSGPACVFQVQCLLGPITAANNDQFANFNVGSGGHQNLGGLSSFTLDDGTLTDTQGWTPPSTAGLPFRVYMVPGTDPTVPYLWTQPGFDPTNAYNIVYVTMAQPGALGPD